VDGGSESQGIIIARANHIQPKTSVKDQRVLKLTVPTQFHQLTAILAHSHQIEVVTAKRVEMPP
jgi:ABC-type oligopeptide transport system ATPase subunit